MGVSGMDDEQQPGLLAVIASTFAAAFGVQSQHNRERDFKHGNIWVFIIAGIIFTLAFIAAVYGVVQAVLPS
ncbi:DUF2970 domain-containing protein [Pseudomaricurvus alkylphenolicus]|uniref:DUF2970 domain-containing protein n=1 Tax=Pseudomaricurvus alkylphenolicus TaxID=1306991 RepID=UPI0019812F86|nr:DUF2970 domain-containing protein [Pseudomaricurvus alkylphenolicus]